MTYRGQVKNGVVVLEGNPPLAEGTHVRVEAVEAVAEATETLGQKLLRHAGTVEGLPTDMAHNHDHYIHGRPKK
jgi:hypothetical protein